MAEQEAVQVDVQATEKADKRKKLIKKVIIIAVVALVVWFVYKKFLK